MAEGMVYINDFIKDMKEQYDDDRK